MAGSTANISNSPVVWAPQPGPQTLLIRTAEPARFFDEVFFGGARGGGKTDGMLGEFAYHVKRYGRCARGIAIRRSQPQLEEMIERARELFEPAFATYHAQAKTLRFHCGALLRFRPLERDRDAERFQGHQYTRVYFEELTNFPDPKPYYKMMATLRSAAGVPCGIRSTGNPGGPGHNWVKQRFIDAGLPMKAIHDVTNNMRMTRLFIPSRLEHNPALTNLDPRYRARLQQMGHRDLVRAWLEGDWDVVAGGMFDDVWRRNVHVVPSLSVAELPKGWRLDRSFDWGSSKPFSVGWWAESNGEPFEYEGHTYGLVRGDLYRIAEWYGWNGNRNEGLKMLATDIADGILERERDWGIADRVEPGPADSAIFAVENGVSIAGDMRKRGVQWTRADKKPGSRKQGWQAMRKMLSGAMGEAPRENPGLFVFDRCAQFIATVPVLPRSDRDPDDADTDAEDHCLAGDTKVMTPSGPKAIAEMEREGVVMTPFGWRPYERCEMKATSAECVEVTFGNGQRLICTPDHGVLGPNGWADAVGILDEMSYCVYPWTQAPSLAQFKSSTESATTDAASTSSVKAFGCTGLYGSITTAEFPMATQFTISMATGPTTVCPISNSWPYPSTQRCTWLSGGRRKSPRRLANAQPNGMDRRPAGSGIGNSTSGIARARCTAGSRAGATIAPASSRGFLSDHVIARTTAGPPLEGRPASTMKFDTAMRAVRHFESINTGKQSTVHGVALVRCRRIRPTQPRDVYCLDVPGVGAFVLASGLVVANCADETRYRVRRRPRDTAPQQVVMM